MAAAVPPSQWKPALRTPSVAFGAKRKRDRRPAESLMPPSSSPGRSVQPITQSPPSRASSGTLDPLLSRYFFLTLSLALSVACWPSAEVTVSVSW